jgi:Periplasmic binding protein
MVAGGLVVLLALASCGTRVPDRDVRRYLAAGGNQAGAGVGPTPSGAQLPGGSGGGKGGGGGKGRGPGDGTGGGGGQGNGPGGGSSRPGGDGGSTPGAGGSNQPGPSPSGPDTGGGGNPPGGGNTPGPGGGTPSPGPTTAQGSCSGGATDVGVTPASVLLGASYAESSLIPGLFRPAIDAVRAYLDMVNRRGGVCGRQLQFRFYNDGLNANTYAQNVRHLVEQDKVFALLGTLSAADSGGCDYMKGQTPPRGAPDLGSFALSYCRAQAPNFYSPVGSLKSGIYGCCAEWQFLQRKFGFQHPAVHYLDVAISHDEGIESVDSLVRTLHQHNRDGIYQGQHSAAQFDYTGDVIDMRNNGVDSVWSSMDLNNDVKLIKAICQQGWRPKLIHLENSSYDPSLIERVGSSCIDSQNIWIRNAFLPFSDPNAEISLYMSTLHAYCSSCAPTPFGLEGWLSAKLLVEQLQRIGADLTRARLYRALDSVRDWTGGGVMGPVTPADRIIYGCNYMLHVTSRGFTRESGLLCGPFYREGDYTGGPVYGG